MGQQMGLPRCNCDATRRVRVQVNYHGSKNYGLKWGNRGIDLLRQVFTTVKSPGHQSGGGSLIEKGFVEDEDKVATLRLFERLQFFRKSCGLTYRIVIRLPASAGDVECISDWGNVVFGDSFDSYYFGTSRYGRPKCIVANRHFQDGQVKAPVLIHATADNKRADGRRVRRFPAPCNTTETCR